MLPSPYSAICAGPIERVSRGASGAVLGSLSVERSLIAADPSMRPVSGRTFGLAKAILHAYVEYIDGWPDTMAVTPSLLARRTFRPSQTSTYTLRAALQLGLEYNRTENSERTTL